GGSKLSNIPSYPNFVEAIEGARIHLLKFGQYVEVGHWQGLDVRGKPFGQFHEALNYSFTCRYVEDLDQLRQEIQPNLPWADDHFEERVSGIPYNPAPSHKEWPFARNKNKDTMEVEGKKFSHTYPERFWPKNAAADELGVTGRLPMQGIRYPYGDLNDVVDLLVRQPHTRQAI